MNSFSVGCQFRGFLAGFCKADPSADLSAEERGRSSVRCAIPAFDLQHLKRIPDDPCFPAALAKAEDP